MTLVHSDEWLTVLHGEARSVLATLEPESAQTVVTSPPYYGLRDYGLPPSVWGDVWEGTLGLEPHPDQYVAHMVEVFRALRRVLRDDGTVWLNLGDSYATGAGSYRNPGSDVAPIEHGGKQAFTKDYARAQPNRMPMAGFKAKDRIMIPARVALALQADGWWLRDEIVWHKTNPMPSSVADRTTPAHEMVYLLTKRARYYYDADAIREPGTTTRPELLAFGPRPDRNGTGHIPDRRREKVPGGWDVTKGEGGHGSVHRRGRTAATYRELEAEPAMSPSSRRQRVGINAGWDASEEAGTAPAGRNKRSVWTIATQPYPEAHFATYPERLVEPMILAGCPPGGVVLDPFGGSGTTAMVANRLGRKAILIDLSEEYIAQAIARIAAARGAGDGPAIDMPVPFKDDGLWAEAIS